MAADGAAGAPRGSENSAYRRYVLILLLVVHVLNYLDRQIVNILAEPIRLELGLRDWQLGLMTGFAFAVFYTALGLPIARYAERGDRSVIIGASIALWSLFTCACGAAQTFIQLVAARIGVGVGEAGCTPAAHSLIIDYAPPDKRASALALYSMGGPLGTLLGLAVGGVIADLWGWRAAFLVVGAPGLLLGVVVVSTLQEPRRRLKRTMAAAAAAPISLAAAIGELKGSRTFRLLCLASAVQAFIAYGHSSFIGSFFFRNHADQLAALGQAFGLQSRSVLGISLGLIMGVSGVVGAYLGGRAGDRFGARDARFLVALPAVANLLAVPTFIAAVLVEDAMLALALLFLPSLLYGASYGPLFAAVQSVVRSQSRATAAAVLLLIINLVGLGAGPVAVGVVSDLIAGPMGHGAGAGVRWSLAWTTLIGLWGAWLYWVARKSIRGEMRGLDGPDGQPAAD